MSSFDAELHNKLVALDGTAEEFQASEILETIPDAVLILDASRKKALAANFDFITLVGRDIQALHRSDFHPLECIHDEDHSRFLDLGHPGGGAPTAPSDLRLVNGSGVVIPVEAFARCYTTGQSVDRWIYFFRPVESRRILEDRLQSQILLQKNRTVEAVKASLRIYQLTEKIRSAPKLSALLLDVESEEELFRRAGEFLVSEGFNYLEVAFFALEEGFLELRYSSRERSCCRYDINKKSRYALFLREEKPPAAHLNDRLVPLRCKGQVLGLLEVKFDPRERAFFKQNSLIEEWHDDIIETIAEILALFVENIRLYQKLRLQTILDPLTSVYNRHHLLNQLDVEIKRAKRFERPLSLIFLDVDGFKEVNDSLGHLQGDLVLREIAKTLGQSMRESDCICRYGGDEFVIILPETTLKAAQRKAERLRVEIESQAFPLIEPTPGRDAVRLTISVGVASTSDDVSADQILQVADGALYGAKRRGKNCVIQIPDLVKA